jgi:hypothetical protein
MRAITPGSSAARPESRVQAYPAIPQMGPSPAAAQGVAARGPPGSRGPRRERIDRIT